MICVLCCGLGVSTCTTLFDIPAFLMGGAGGRAVPLLPLILSFVVRCRLYSLTHLTHSLLLCPTALLPCCPAAPPQADLLPSILPLSYQMFLPRHPSAPLPLCSPHRPTCCTSWAGWRPSCAARPTAAGRAKRRAPTTPAPAPARRAPPRPGKKIRPPLLAFLYPPAQPVPACSCQLS